MRAVVIILVLFQFQAVAQQTEPLQFVEKSFDFGEISETGGSAEHEFVFTNNSGRAIRILNVQASCGCTTPGWTKDPIQPGYPGSVKASFDPKGRPGFFNKSLTVSTDASSSSVILQIKGLVVGEKEKEQLAGAPSEFPVKNGNLLLKFNSFPLGKLSINRPPATKEFIVFNAGPKTINFTGKVVGPAYIKTETPKSIDPNQKGKIRITYDAKGRNQYGFVSDNIEIETDDDQQAVKSFSVFATLEEYFPVPTPDDLAKAPLLILEPATLNIGKLREGDTFVQEVTVKNVGKSDLLIRAVQGNCTCVTAGITAKQIKPGAEVKLKISFATSGRTGIQQKAVTLYTNDPKNPVQRVVMSGFVEAAK